MKLFQNPEFDNEDDTALFAKLEEYVIEHYPNPSRTGCLDEASLEAIVEKPATVELADPKYLHIFKCRECTLVLRKLRRDRERRQDRGEDPP